MKISTNGRYALLLIIDLAQHQDEGFVSLKEIANRQGISKKYLEQIVIPLNQAHMLSSNRGSQGGYRLIENPRTISVYDILSATEECMLPVSCLETGNHLCDRENQCMIKWMWEGLSEVTQDYLKSISLQDLVDHTTPSKQTR